MARPNRSEVISPGESCVVQVNSHVVRRCFLMGGRTADRQASKYYVSFQPIRVR
ncbi:MAG: hypothetical protein IT422_20845 [Pirellulaceae bacterium]|nr:hypothetical protein [Pirellulaceae bacterium]